MVGRKSIKLGKPKHGQATRAARLSKKDKKRAGAAQTALGGPPLTVPTTLPIDPMYRVFVDYALQQHRLGAAGSGRISAVLSQTSSLEVPDTIPCGTHPSAAIVDIDAVPGDILGAAQLDAALAEVRKGGVKILWVADVPVTSVDEVRDRLWANGGVGDSEDRLLLKRLTDDRKQTLRRDAAESYCIVAVVGTRKGDIDELYDYIRDPAQASRLDRFWGSGWFIVPGKPAVAFTKKD